MQPCPVIAELAGMCGYDFVMLDAEHGLLSHGDMLHAIQALAGTAAVPIVRLAGHDAQDVGRYLDMGASAIVVPNVSTAEQATVLVRSMEYPPAGTRGFGAPGHRVTRYGLDIAEHFKRPRGEASLIVMIESALGVTNAEAILGVDGVDGALIGPSDLSAGLGCLGDFSQAGYIEAFSRIETAAASSGKYLGTVPHPGSSLADLVARGFRLLILGSDVSLMRIAMSAQVAEARALS
jgi:2-keto-3-deoxy-L-rhamnonate aldolase RhmA